MSSPVLLRVDSSPRANSVTRALTSTYADAWLAEHPDGTIIRHDLPALDLPHLGANELGAWFADPAHHTDLHGIVLDRSNRLVDDVLAADEILVGAPMWNFGIPSILKAWIDHVVRAGRTVEFGADGPVGAVPASRVIIVTSRGSDFRPGSPFEAADFQEPYLRQILGFIGLQNVVFVHADHQGPNWPDSGDVLDQARREMIVLAAESLRAA